MLCTAVWRHSSLKSTFSQHVQYVRCVLNNCYRSFPVCGCCTVRWVHAAVAFLVVMQLLSGRSTVVNKRYCCGKRNENVVFMVNDAIFRIGCSVAINTGKEPKRQIQPAVPLYRDITCTTAVTNETVLITCNSGHWWGHSKCGIVLLYVRVTPQVEKRGCKEVACGSWCQPRNRRARFVRQSGWCVLFSRI